MDWFCTFYATGYSLIFYADNVIELIFLATLFTIGEVIYFPYKQNQFLRIVSSTPDKSKGAYFSIERMNIHWARMTGTLTIALFPLFNIYIVSLIYFLIPIIGAYLIMILSNITLEDNEG